jgi:hypothetical protein
MAKKFKQSKQIGLSTKPKRVVQGSYYCKHNQISLTIQPIPFSFIAKRLGKGSFKV